MTVENLSVGIAFLTLIVAFLRELVQFARVLMQQARSRSRSMNIIRVCAWVYIFVVPAAAVHLYGLVAASEAIVLGAVIMFFAHLDKFKTFKASSGGIEGELRDAVNEAYATIESVRRIAVDLAKPVVTELTLHGQFLNYMPLSGRFESLQAIEKNLRDMGVKEAEIEDAVGVFYDFYRTRHIQMLMFAVIKHGNVSAETTATLRPIAEQLSQSKDWSVDRVLLAFPFTPHPEIDERAEDARYFEKHRKFRRMEIWTN